MSPDSLTQATIEYLSSVRPELPIRVTKSAEREFRKFYADALERDSDAVAAEIPRLLDRIGNIAGAEFKQLGPAQFGLIRELICPRYPWC
jgi:hypothetical protein